MVSNTRHSGENQNKAYKGLVADELSCEPQEGLLEVVVGLGGDVVVLEVLLAVEGDGLGLDLALLDIDLVTGENDGDVLADTDEITCGWGLLAGLEILKLRKNAGQGDECLRCQLGTFL